MNTKYDDDELDVPNLIPPDHGPDKKSNHDDDDDIMMMSYAKVIMLRFQFLPFSSMETMYPMIKFLMMMHYKNYLFIWIIKDMIQMRKRMRSVCNQVLKQLLIQKF